MRGGRGGRGRGFGRGGNSFIQNFLRDNGDDRNANEEDAPPQLYNIYYLIMITHIYLKGNLMLNMYVQISANSYPCASGF